MKWFMVVLAVIAALIVGIYVLDLADIIDVKAITMTALDKWSVTHPYIETYRLGLSEDILLQEKKDELLAFEAELLEMQSGLMERQKNLDRREQELNSREKRLEDERLALEKDRQDLLAIKANVESLRVEAMLLSEMETRSVLAILENLPEDRKVDLLASMDQDTVIAILQSMDPQEAAALLPKVSSKMEGR